MISQMAFEKVLILLKIIREEDSCDHERIRTSALLIRAVRTRFAYVYNHPSLFLNDMKRAGTALPLAFVILALCFVPIAAAEIRLDMPTTLTEIVPYRVTLVVNEPSLQKYTDTIHIQCSHCDVLIEEGDQPEEDRYSAIDLRGRTSVSFFIVGRFDERERTATGTVSSIKFFFTGDYEELRRDFPKAESLSSEFAYYTKHFAVVRSKKDFTLPSLPSSTEEEFEYDEFFGSYRFYDRGNLSEKDPRLVRFSFSVTDLPCIGQDNEYSYYCGSQFSLENIEKGQISDGTPIEKQSLLGGSGYRYVYDGVDKVVAVRDKDGKLLYNLGLVNVGLVFDVFNEAEKINYEGRCEQSSYVKEGDQDSYVNKAVSECESVLETYVRKPVGSSPGNIPKDIVEYNLPVREAAKPTIQYAAVNEQRTIRVVTAFWRGCS